MDYIRFYNLRNYDRINVSSTLDRAQNVGGVPYEEARQDHDTQLEGTQALAVASAQATYQAAAAATAKTATDKWDTVSECYMLGGADIRSVPWTQGNVAEIDAFVSEELYVHSKVRSDN